MLGPIEATGPAQALTVVCRRFRCVPCGAVVLVVPRSVLPRRWYSASAIALALALHGIDRLSPPAIRRQISPFGKVGVTAASGWVTLRRWADAVRAGRLLPEVRRCPPGFTRRQVAERAAATLGSRAPPPADAPLAARAFVGAAHVG